MAQQEQPQDKRTSELIARIIKALLGDKATDKKPDARQLPAGGIRG
jgi:hypothetical protein